jgi:hypothetical protein
MLPDFAIHRLQRREDFDFRAQFSVPLKQKKCTHLGAFL